MPGQFWRIQVNNRPGRAFQALGGFPNETRDPPKEPAERRTSAGVKEVRRRRRCGRGGREGRGAGVHGASRSDRTCSLWLQE